MTPLLSTPLLAFVLSGAAACGSDKNDSESAEGDADVDADADTDADGDTDSPAPYDTGPFSKPGDPSLFGTFNDGTTDHPFDAEEGSWMVVGVQTYLSANWSKPGFCGGMVCSLSVVVNGDLRERGTFPLESVSFIYGDNNSARGDGRNASFEVTAHDESGEFLWGNLTGSTVIEGKSLGRLEMTELVVESWPKI